MLLHIAIAASNNYNFERLSICCNEVFATPPNVNKNTTQNGNKCVFQARYHSIVRLVRTYITFGVRNPRVPGGYYPLKEVQHKNTHKHTHTKDNGNRVKDEPDSRMRYE